MASNTVLITSWTNFSRGSPIVRGLWPPLALAIITLFPGEKVNASDLSSAIRPSRYSEEIPSRVLGDIPGVIIPGLDFSLL
uniref:Uncharacterized protein n=1 Tax=Phlebia radiata TaxID=5308 RepID=L8B9G5_PHLRA|nr:hypothetical protein Pra_mt0320 [Phlebia radiata]CCF07388.1 hypothetical protein Pra_mt0320 [Phlebia radiata]